MKLHRSRRPSFLLLALLCTALGAGSAAAAVAGGEALLPVAPFALPAAGRLLAANAETPAPSQSDEAADVAAAAKAPASGLTPQILYEFLLAEIAINRGQLPLAAAALMDLAKTTRDVRIAKRATEVAYFGQQPALALTAVRLWLELEPGSEQARQILWTLLAATGKTDELASALSTALQAEGPQAGAALLQINRLFSRVQDKQAVQRLVEKVSLPYLSQPEARYARAVAAVNAGDEVGAKAEIGEALRLKPDWEAAALFKAQLSASKPEEALAVLDQFLARSGDGREFSDTRLARARLLVELKRYPEGRQAFTQLLKQQPDNPELLYAAGLLSLQVNDMASGEKYLRRLLDMNFADKDTVRLYLGQAAEDRGDAKEALAYYDAISPGHPRYVSAQSRGAALLHGMGRSDEALERLQRALSVNPREKLQLLLAQVQVLSEKGKEGDAYAVLDQALAAEPDEPVLLYETSLLAEKLGKYDVLETHLRKLIRLRPDHAQAYNALGYSFVDRNVRLEEARELLDKALSLAPEDPFILDSRGWLDFRLGNLSEAEVNLRKAASLRSDAEFAAHLGEVLWARGKQNEARQVWDAALKADPNNALLNSTRKRLLP